METTRRQRTLQVLFLLACCLAAPFWANCQRAVIVREASSYLLISEAKKHVGVTEATGHNDGVWVERYLKSTGLGKGYPWCAAFQSYIHKETCMGGPRSARVVDWFKYNVVWKQEWGNLPEYSTPGMVGGLYYRKLGRLGHIFLIVGEDKNNFYTIEGNTNFGGSREGDGVYRKIRSKKSVAALADYCLDGKLFIDTYDDYLRTVIK